MQFLGAFAKLRIAIISFVMYVYPFVGVAFLVKQLGSHCTDFREIQHLTIFRKPV